jgi:hypothetical protein
MAQPQNQVEQALQSRKARLISRWREHYSRALPKDAPREPDTLGRLVIRSRRLVHAFCSVQVIDDTVKCQVLPRIRYHVVRAEALRMRTFRWNAVLPLVFIPCFFIAVLVPTLLQSGDPDDSTIRIGTSLEVPSTINIGNVLQASLIAGAESLIGLMSITIIFALGLLPIVMRGRRRRRTSGSSPNLWLFIFLFLIAVIGVILFLSDTSTTHVAGRIMLRGALATSIYFGLGILILTIFGTFSRHLTTTRMPDSVAVTELLRILRLASRSPASWTRMDVKRDMMARLEIVALCVQYGLPRQLGSSDVVTDLWIKEQAHEMASALRNLKGSPHDKVDSRWLCGGG